jgi:hypothetical protein
MADSERNKVKVETIDQIGIVVKDCEKVAQQWERMLGIGPWTIITQNATDSEGDPLEVKLAFAYVGDLEFELIEIAKGKTMHSEWLGKHGEGLHHLSFFVDDPDGVAASLVEQGGLKLCCKGRDSGFTWTAERAVLSSSLRESARKLSVVDGDIVDRVAMRQ